MMLGDFNMVEDASDRLPAHVDQPTSVQALAALRQGLGMTDGWRLQHPDDTEYTYVQTATGSQSRIDRIYVTDELDPSMDAWENVPAPINADHRIVSVRVEDLRAPYIGTHQQNNKRRAHVGRAGTCWSAFPEWRPVDRSVSNRCQFAEARATHRRVDSRRYRLV